MSNVSLLTLRLTLAGFGVVLWGLGYRTGRQGFLVGGIVLMALSLLARWIRPKQPPDAP
jgi:hypothetical protein